MVYAKCINKEVQNSLIVSYTLKDETGNVMTVTPVQLKAAMSKNLIDIVNLTLTSDGRLVDKVKKPEYMTCVGSKFNSNGQIETYQLKSNTGNIINVGTLELINRLRKNPYVVTNIKLGADGLPYVTQY